MSAMTKPESEGGYGKEKGKKVFYASRNKGTISGVDPESQDEEQIAGPSVAEKSRMNSKRGIDAPTASMPSEELSRPDTNPTVPNAMSDAMDSLKARSVGGVSLDTFGFGREVDKRAGSPSYFAFGAPTKANDAPTSSTTKMGSPDYLNWGAPFAFSGETNGQTAPEVKGGVTASGMGAGGIGQGKDAGLGKAQVSGATDVAKLWK